METYSLENYNYSPTMDRFNFSLSTFNSSIDVIIFQEKINDRYIFRIFKFVDVNKIYCNLKDLELNIQCKTIQEILNKLKELLSEEDLRFYEKRIFKYI